MEGIELDFAVESSGERIDDNGAEGRFGSVDFGHKDSHTREHGKSDRQEDSGLGAGQLVGHRVPCGERGLDLDDLNSDSVALDQRQLPL